MKDKDCVITKLGKITIEKDNCSDYPSIFLKLNGVPIILLEQNKIDGEDKIIIKNYHNEKTIIDDNYMNLDKFEIDMDEIDKIRDEVLKDLND